LRSSSDASQVVTLTAPLTDEAVARLRAGDPVRIRGVVYVARDAAHQRLMNALDKGQPLPFDPQGQLIYYMGPTPARPGKPIGSCGPTTAGRMDVYTPALLEAGLKGMIGKGNRSPTVREALRDHHAVYLTVTGGVAALVARSVKAAQVVAYPELGPEALLRLEVEDMPAIVANDMYGGDVYELGKARYRR